MRYIGPFFRMNSLSQKEISGQLFYLSKESIKTIVLNSKCGLLAQVRSSKKSSINDISILNNFSPVVCLYRKASPMFVHSKTSHGFDESSFKKEINPSANAFMTLCILELSEYYSHYNQNNRNVISLEKPYKYLAKEQLEFYYNNLRNDEGLFVTKKNTSDSNSRGFSLINKNDKFKFSDQAFMMNAYFLYANYNKDDKTSDEYLKFSTEILELFKNYNEILYDLSFSENVQIFLALNVFFKHSNNLDAKELILDLGDFLISKFEEKDYYLDSLDDCALFSICLMEAYKHTGILSFKEESKEINEKLISLYSPDKNIFIKRSDKKEIKYSCLEVNNYILSLISSSLNDDKSNDLKPIISSIYRKFYINSGLLTSWPEAPTLDEVERYKNLSLKSDDMLDETYFRMSASPTPKSSGSAPVFLKNLTYSKKKNTLSCNKSSFDSEKNMFNFFLIIYLLKDNIENLMGFNENTNTNDNNLDIEEKTIDEKEISLSSNSIINNQLNTSIESEKAAPPVNRTQSQNILLNEQNTDIKKLPSKIEISPLNKIDESSLEIVTIQKSKKAKKK